MADLTLLITVEIKECVSDCEMEQEKLLEVYLGEKLD